MKLCKTASLQLYPLFHEPCLTSTPCSSFWCSRWPCYQLLCQNRKILYRLCSNVWTQSGHRLRFKRPQRKLSWRDCFVAMCPASSSRLSPMYRHFFKIFFLTCVSPYFLLSYCFTSSGCSSIAVSCLLTNAYMMSFFCWLGIDRNMNEFGT